ncbi:hypothetical protein ISU10_11210 [Nocardioides agariphilus]|uniref:Uncharacterized protein n=1 Tax=Nocardioides agariphilus TaxID=433664 RepID=A0A930VP62_9ACTN|nr:hypothetical protein [Nocardioides agariphilus]MBF4768335.1 hypothetical protein [Nocardioides agariphilus]
MKKVPNSHTPHTVQSLRAGDFVEVRLNAHLSGGLVGYVRAASKLHLRLLAHSFEGPYVEVEAAKGVDCLAWDLYIPMSSIAWIRHLPLKADECSCSEGLA